MTVPVPYVTRWSAEVNTEPLGFGLNPATRRAAYADETILDRDRWGVLWTRCYNRRGQGSPEWSQVHSIRQRRCMLEHRCQVCGTKLDSPIWVAQQLRAEESIEGFVTQAPPLCAPCVPISFRHCPHLRKQSPVWGHGEVEHWGWLMDFYGNKGNGYQERVFTGDIHKDAEQRWLGIARQLLVWVRMTEVLGGA